MTSMAASTVPKFYKSVIDDVVNNIREIFLDDGVDEQVIQDLRTIWERKITDTRAIEHATNNNSNTNSNNTSNSKSKSNSHANKQAAAAAAAAANQQSQSAAGAQTSVITSNPNHMKNGPSSNANNNNSNSAVRVKDEIVEEEQQQHHSQQQHQATARRPVTVTTQPQLTTMVQPASPMVTTNGNLIHHQNLAQVSPNTNILRASAIVTNPSGPASLPPGLNASNSGHLIQVLQQPNSALRHQNYSTQAQPQAAAQPSAPSTSGQISSNRPSTIYTIIPSPSSSFSPVIVSSSGGQTAATSSSTFTTNHYKSGGGNSVGTFTPKIVMPKVTGVGGGSGQVPHTTAEHLTNMNNVQQNRIVSIAPHGHKKRILNSINNGLNGSVVSGASFGGGNLTSLADVAVSHTNQNTHLLNSMNLARQQAVQRLQLGNLNATASAGANLATTAGHRGLVTHAALQSMAAPNNNNHQQQHIILGPGSAGSGVTGKQEPMKFQTIIGPNGQKMMILPNNTGGQYVMAAPSTQFVLTPEILNQINLSGGILTTGPNGQPTVLQRAPGSFGASTIQYATAPGIQQVRTVAAPGLMQQLAAAQPQLGQPGTANATNTRVAQLDGLGDSSSEDEDEDDYRDNDDDQDDNDDEMNDEENDGGIEDEEPLNSGDDVSEEDPNELFDTDNVVVCQYDKITRSRNKWKFHFKDGIMNLQGKDYVFQKAVGDAEW